jgi:FkbM family methyltransferase
MSFLMRQDRCALCIPGHLPIAWAQSSGRPFDRRGRPRFYEETTTLVLTYLIERFHPAVLFDVGAAVGYFSRVAASTTRVATRVHAFEMLHDRIGKLREAVSKDDFGHRISVHHAAVSDAQKADAPVWFARGGMLFEQRPDPKEYREAWWRRLKFALRHDKSRGLAAAKIPVTSIDHFAGQLDELPDIVKIDVEGYEGRVLAGGKKTFAARPPFVLLELHKEAKLRFNARRVDVAKMLFDLGYEGLFFTDHENRQQCEIVQVEPGSSLLARQETDLILFFHPEYLSRRATDAKSRELLQPQQKARDSVVHNARRQNSSIGLCTE